MIDEGKPKLVNALVPLIEEPDEVTMMDDGGGQVVSFPGWRSEFAEMNQIGLHQRVRAAEVMMPFMMNSRYDIENPDGKRVIHARELSHALCRNCCRSECKSWKMAVSQVQEDVHASPFLKMDKPFACTFLCCNRPKVEVREVQNADKLMGWIDAPFHCCDCPMVVRNADGRMTHKASLAKPCWLQPGLCCLCPCGPCKTVKFKIEDAGGGAVGGFSKDVPSCAVCVFSPKTFNYDVKFQADTTDSKAMLMATALALDVTYFNCRGP